ncbi:MAG: AraC family transcriptional regulator [Hyphomicrobiales bacterium]
MKIEPRTKSAGARLVVNKLRQAGIDVEPVLSKAGLKLQVINKEDGWIDYSAVETFTQLAAVELNDPHLGLHLGEQEDILEYGALGYIGLASQNLGDAISNLQRYLHTVTEAWEIELCVEDDEANIVYFPTRAEFLDCRHMVEGAACSLMIAYQTFCNRPIRPKFVHFAHSCNGSKTEHEIVLGCPVDFNRNRNRIVLERSALGLPIETADDRLLKTLTRLCEKVYQQKTSRASHLVSRIHKVAMDFIPQGKAYAKEIATEIGMSERTMHRYLAEEGKSFSDVLDELKKELALKYMKQDGLNLSEVAFLLGYADHSGFSTAFKRWTGKTPREARVVSA